MFINHPKFTIRPIDRQDPHELNRVLDVYRQCEDFLALGPVAVASPQMVQADLDFSVKEGGDFCGIFDPINGTMMGIIDAVFSGFEGQRDLAFLSLLMIGVPYRKQGLGEAVVRAFEEEVNQRGEVRAIRSGTQVNNPAAIRFWLRMGYKVISRPELLPDNTICYQLLKVLNKNG